MIGVFFLVADAAVAKKSCERNFVAVSVYSCFYIILNFTCWKIMTIYLQWKVFEKNNMINE